MLVTKAQIYTMEAQLVYINVWRLSLKSASNMSRRRIQELNAGIGELRQLLSCVVCRELLRDPYQPAKRRCGHHVCRLCLRGRKRLKPSCKQCSDCFDFKTYKENKSMAWQILCYKTLCLHLQNSFLFAQLSGYRLSNDRSLRDRSIPRIELPDEPTQWFIQEGANFIDMCDTFLTQSDMFTIKDISSLPAETPPTTAATTPELPYEQHMPEQLSITDIELEAAATGDHAQFTHPLPLMSSSARLLNPRHVAPQPQIVSSTGEPIITAGYIEPSWTDQVDLSAAFSMPAFGNSSTNYTTYVLPSSELHLPTIGQVVQMTQTPLEQVTASTSTAASVKRRHAEMQTDDIEENVQEQDSHVESVTSATTRMSLRNQKAKIISSVQVKPPSVIAPPTPISVTVPVAATIPKIAANVNPKVTSTPKVEAALKSTTSSKTRPAPKAVATSKVTALPRVTATSKTATTPEIATEQSTVDSIVATATKATPAKALRNASQKVKSKEKHNCRCGTSSAPSLMTCRNGRCACYSSGYKCVDCKCNGCKNPHTYSGGETSDEESEEQGSETETVTEELTPTTAEETPSEPMQTGYTLVPLENLQQSKLPLVLIQNECGEFQSFNIFMGNKPIDPPQPDFQRVPLQRTDGNSSIPEYAYVPAPPPQPQPSSPLPPPPPPSVEQPFKKFKSVTSMKTRSSGTDCTLSTRYSHIESVDELLGGNSKSKASTGDGLVTDKAHSLFEDIMSGSDDL